MFKRYLSTLCLCVCLQWALVGCFTISGEAPNDGGFNRGRQQSGNQEGGTNLWMGHIAIHKTGNYFISRSGADLWLGDIQRKTLKKLDLLSYADRMVFHEEKSIIYTIRTNQKHTELSLSAYDLKKDAMLWDIKLEGRWNLNELRIDFEPQTEGVLFTGQTQVKMYEATTGALRWEHKLEKNLSFPGGLFTGIRDVDIARKQNLVIVTMVEIWPKEKTPASLPVQKISSRLNTGTGTHELESLDPTLLSQAGPTIKRKYSEFKTIHEFPKSFLYLIESKTGNIKRIAAPNCAGELLVAKDGDYAFLAPTTCTRPDIYKIKSNASQRIVGKDPISVINLEARTWERNLPGFGPVALSEDGRTAVAFMDRQALDPTLFASGLGKWPAQEGPRYMLMFIDTRTLRFTHMNLSDQLPRFTLTPDGKHLILDVSKTFGAEAKLQILELETQTLRKIKGEDARFEHFVLTPDSKSAYVLDRKLFHLAIEEAQLNPLFLGFVPTSINITPDGALLLIKDEKTEKIQMYCLKEKALCGEFGGTQR